MVKHIFVVITHSYSPAEGDKWAVTENCEFVSHLKRRHLDQASMIIDLKKAQVVKSRESEGTYSQYLQYVEDNYPEQMTELRQKFASEFEEA